MGAARSSLRQLLPADHGQHPTRLLRPVPDEEGFAALYREHSASVHAAALRITGRPSDAEDITQEVFARLWRDPSRFDPARGEIGSYLRLMARSRALDLWRHEQAAGRARERLKVVAADEDRTEDHPAAVAEREGRRRGVRAALRELPREQREAIVLSYWVGLGPDDVSRRAGVPFGTARSRVRLGLEKLRRSVSPDLRRGGEDA